ncbi:MAG TPA: carboxypeptidase-like regulatory domain-containing protein [Blastocatellia bacterium]|nr:carboxypeptidase-like regulatory domain-containing protein [Blastocatellia bacterium]
MMTSFRTFLFSLSSLLILLVCSASAQQSGGRSSQTSDEKLSGIQVILEQPPSGKRLATQTDASGRFSFRDVEAGKYKLLIGCSSSNAGSAQPEKCLAEFQITITDKSSGEITGKVGKSEDKK